MILQLDLFCKNKDTWTGLAYVRAFFVNPDLRRECYINSTLLVALKSGAYKAAKSLSQAQPP